MKRNKIGLLAAVVLVTVASLFTVCKATGVGAGLFNTVIDQTIEVAYGEEGFRALQPTEKKLLNIVMPVDAEDSGEPVPPVELGEIALSDGEYILGIKIGDFAAEKYTLKVYDPNLDGDNNPDTPAAGTPQWPLDATRRAVTFEPDGGSLSGANPQIVNVGESVTRPEPDPYKADYTFDGWWSEAALATVYDFTSPVNTNISVWAKWTARGTIINSGSHDLMVKFGVKDAEGYALTSIEPEDVTNTFEELHAYLQSAASANLDTDIEFGDYIDLKSLSVAGYPVDNDEEAYGKIENLENAGTYGHDGFSTTNLILRLIVVGKNSFSANNKYGYVGGREYGRTLLANGEPEYSGGGTGSDSPHLVFQFQNAPRKHRMNPTDTAEGGYKDSEARAYLVPVPGKPGSGAYLEGLKAAGVPFDSADNIIWAPVRKLAKEYNSAQGSGDTNDIADALWLPTYSELFGFIYGFYGPTVENASNQAELGYTNFLCNRAKLSSNSLAMDGQWWMATPSNSYSFGMVDWSGNSSSKQASQNAAISPAFCVR